MGLDADTTTTTTTTPLNNSLSQSNQHDTPLNDKSSKRHGPKRKPRAKQASSTADNVTAPPPEGSTPTDSTTSKKRRGPRRTPRGAGPKTEEGQTDSPKDTVNKKRQRSSKKTPQSSSSAAASSSSSSNTVDPPTPVDDSQQQQQQPDSASKDKPANKKKSRRSKGQKAASSSENTAPNTTPLHLAKHRDQAKLTTEDDDQNDDQEDKVKKGPSRRSRRSGKKKASASASATTADDLASGLAQDLRTATYECMVCWDVVRTGHQTWTCDCCWAVFHLSCIKKWATRSLQGIYKRYNGEIAMLETNMLCNKYRKRHQQTDYFMALSRMSIYTYSHSQRLSLFLWQTTQSGTQSLLDASQLRSTM